MARRQSSAAASRSGSRWPRARARAVEGAPDTVITNAVVLDHWGVVKADVGLRDGRIVALGRAGNPDIADGVHPDLVIGPSTDVISGEGRILTAGAIDVARALPVDLAGARGPGDRHHHRRRWWHRTVGGLPGHDRHPGCLAPARRSHRALDHLPVNVLLMGKGNTVSAAGLAEQALAGAAAYKVHEDWGSTPAAIDAALRAADEHGLQVALHSDSLNEAGFLESTVAAIAGRSIHAFHTEGAGGGHAPDIIEVAGAPPRDPGVDQPDAAAHRQHRRRAPRHADGLPPPQPAGARGPRVRGVADPRHHDRRRGRAARPGRALGHLVGRPGDGPDRRGRSAGRGRSPT